MFGDHRVGRDPGTRLGVRLPDWVGDVIAADPALRLVGEAFDEVHCYGPGFARQLVPAGTNYTRVTSRHEERRALRSHRIRRYLILKPSFGAALAGFGLGRDTVGYAGHYRKWLLSGWLPPEAGVAKSESLLRLTEAALARWGRSQLADTGAMRSPRIDLSTSEIDAACGLLSRYGLAPRQFLVCCPLAATRAGDPEWKRWPHFNRLSNALSQSQVAHVACPGPGEAEECVQRLPQALLIEGTDLRQYAAIMAVSGGVITNDTGPMHLATAVGVVPIALFGDTDPVRMGTGSAAAVRTLGAPGAWPRFEEVWKEVEELTTGFKKALPGTHTAFRQLGARLTV